MRCSRLFISFILLFAPLGAYAMTGDKAEFQKLADDVYAFVGKLNDANAMAIVTTQGVVRRGHRQQSARDAHSAKIRPIGDDAAGPLRRH